RHGRHGRARARRGRVVKLRGAGGFLSHGGMPVGFLALGALLGAAARDPLEEPAAVATVHCVCVRAFAGHSGDVMRAAVVAGGTGVEIERVVSWEVCYSHYIPFEYGPLWGSRPCGGAFLS